MSDQSLKDLCHITKARFQADQAGIRDLLEEEGKVRRAIEELDAQHAQARNAQRNIVGAQRHIGGDVLWQGWVARSRRALQVRLAQILARKAQKLRSLNRSHGRKLASETLFHAHLAERSKHARSKNEEQEQSLILLKAAAVRRS